MRFLIDANLPPRLAAWLREAGHEADYSNDVLGPGATDIAIVEKARATGAVIVTKDRDFADLIAAPSPPILWVRAGDIANPALTALFDDAFAAPLARLEAGEAVVEIG